MHNISWTRFLFFKKHQRHKNTCESSQFRTWVRSPAGRVRGPTEPETTPAASAGTCAALLWRKPEPQTLMEIRTSRQTAPQSGWRGRPAYLVEAVLVGWDDVRQSQRLLVSGGALQYAEEQEGEARQTQRTQRCHLVASLRVFLQLLQTNVIFTTRQ